MSAEIERRALYPAATLARLVPEVPVDQLVEALDILARLGHIWRAESASDVRYAYRAPTAAQTSENDADGHAGPAVPMPQNNAHNPEETHP